MTQNKSVAFYTLGCKLNFAESATIKRQFLRHHFELRSFDSISDIYVINTCSVTQDAVRDCRKVIRRARRNNPEAFIVVAGCYAQLDPAAISTLEGVDLIVGIMNKFDILKLAGNFEKPDTPLVHRGDVFEAVDFHHAYSSGDRTRAFLKVQDGCDYTCCFCTIPEARGKSRSPSIEQVIENARKISENGYREIVLTGVNIGDFGKNTGESLLDLLRSLDRLPGLERVRISSIEPNLLTKEIVHFVAESRTLQPHFHIPLQSGSDKLLQIMKRRYRTNLFKKRIETILSCVPDACIGIDVITGHPGETDSCFKETLDVILSTEISYLHVFTYSEKSGTPASRLSGSVPPHVRKERTKKLRRLSDKKRFDFDTRFIGSHRPVLLEQQPRNNRLLGWTDNYIRVSVPFDETLINHIVLCRLKERLPSHPVIASVSESGKI